MPKQLQGQPPGKTISISEVPQALRPTAKILLYQTGRTGLTGLTEQDLSCLRRLYADHYPARIQSEIERIVESFRKSGKDPGIVDFCYIADAMRNRRPSRKSDGAGSGPAGAEPAPQRPDLDALADDYKKALLEQYGEEES